MSELKNPRQLVGFVQARLDEDRAELDLLPVCDLRTRLTDALDAKQTVLHELEVHLDGLPVERKYARGWRHALEAVVRTLSVEWARHPHYQTRWRI